jgi:pimeloyl-ACP methyl ester carboxylesterase
MRTSALEAVTSSDGVPLACASWAFGSGEATILAVHATGFCKEVFRPVAVELGALGADFEMITMDQRGHGDSGTPDPPFDWWDLARDALCVADGRTGIIGVGHSSGGAALIMAELLDPGTFAALLLVEPIIFPDPADTTHAPSLAAAARNRRRTFASPEAAMTNWRGRGPFRNWDERALEAYARGGLRHEDGAWVLKCAPEIEAQFYLSSTAHGAFARLGEVDSSVHLLAGEHSNTHRPALVDAIVGSIAGATGEIVPNAGHFLPMECPDVVAARLSSMIDPGLGAAPR